MAEPNYPKNYQKQPTDLIERLLEAKIDAIYFTTPRRSGRK
jgi:hypothetical protein